MGKDREGTFHPPKGKPSGMGTQKGLVTTDSSTMDQQLEIEEKYTDNPDLDELASNVRVRHPNRNVDKGNDRKISENKKGQSNKAVTETLKEQFTATEPKELSALMSKESLAELANYSSDCCISVYIPTHRSGVAVNEQKDTIAFKNALQQIETTLKERGFEQIKIAKILKPGYDLLRDDKFWYALTDGLAVYMADGVFQYIKLPTTPQEHTLVNTSFYLSPLVPYLLNREYFYLLVISKKQAKLFRLDNFGIQHIPISEMPNGVDDVVHFEEKDNQKLFRTGSSGAGEGANYHGTGSGMPDEKEHITMYLDEVDETLWKEVLNTENVPLLLGGVEYLIPLFNKVTKYRHVWEKSLTGSLEHEDEQELYKKAREVMEPYFRERLNKAKEVYGNQSATALTSSIAEDVIPAAYYSRISQLFVQKGEHIWGKFDEKANELTIHEEQAADDDSLLDKAVLKTILNGGEVFLVDKEDMPAPSKLAAIMRY